MKFFIFLSLISVQAWSITTDQYCSLFPFNEEKLRCYRTVLNKHIEEKALDVCMKFSFESERFECLQWVLDRKYSSSELDTCFKAVFDSDRRECIINSGKPYSGLDELQKLRTAGSKAKNAREYLQNGQFTKTDELLKEIIQLAK